MNDDTTGQSCWRPRPDQNWSELVLQHQWLYLLFISLSNYFLMFLSVSTVHTTLDNKCSFLLFCVCRKTTQMKNQSQPKGRSVSDPLDETQTAECKHFTLLRFLEGFMYIGSACVCVCVRHLHCTEIIMALIIRISLCICQGCVVWLDAHRPNLSVHHRVESDQEHRPWPWTNHIRLCVGSGPWWRKKPPWTQWVEIMGPLLLPYGVNGVSLRLLLQPSQKGKLTPVRRRGTTIKSRIWDDLRGQNRR